MSPEEISAQYHNLKYAVLSICDCIESCSVKKVVEEKYLPMLDDYHNKLVEIKKELGKEMSDSDKQKGRWAKKVKCLSIEALLDETLSDELKERITLELEELARRIEGHDGS